MKSILSTLVALVTAPALFADVAVYSGSTVTKTTSAAGSGTSVTRMIEIVDLASGQSQGITLTKGRGRAGTFTVEAVLPSTLTIVKDSKNRKSSAVISLAATTTDATTGVTTTASVLLQGKLSSAVISGTAATFLPKQLQGVISQVSSAGTTPVDPLNPTVPGTAIASELAISTPVLNLDANLSKRANSAAPAPVTLEAALASVKATLVASGFTEKP